MVTDRRKNACRALDRDEAAAAGDRRDALAVPPSRDMKLHAVRGGAVTLTSQGCRFALQLGCTAVLGRLLTPADYGLVAMVTALTGFVAIFKDLGLSMATVRWAEVTHRQVSTLFWINVGVSVVITAATAAIAPAVAWFYREPHLVWVTLALSGNFILAGLTTQHYALLRRQMRFNALATMEVVGLASGIATAIAMASLGAGYWALVGMSVANSLSNLVIAWTCSGWRPGPPVRGSGVRQMLKFGGNLTGFNVTNYLVRNLDNVLIGWWWGGIALGLYAKAYQLLLLPIQQIVHPISGVAQPVLSRLQNEPDRYRSHYVRGISLLATFGMPVVAATFVLAEPLITMLMGDAWLNVVPVYRVLAVAAFVDTVNVATGWVYTTLGHTDRQFRWQILESAITVAAFSIALPFGIMGVAVAFSATRVLCRVPALAYCYRGTPIRMSDYVGAVWRPSMAAIGAGIATWIAADTGRGWWGTSATELFVLSVFFAGLYLGLWCLLPGGWQCLADIWGAGAELLPERFRRTEKRPPATAAASAVAAS